MMPEMRGQINLKCPLGRSIQMSSPNRSTTECILSFEKGLPTGMILT